MDQSMFLFTDKVWEAMFEACGKSEPGVTWVHSTTWPSHFFSRPPKTRPFGHGLGHTLWSWKSPCWDLVSVSAWLSAASVASPSASCSTPRGWTSTVAWTGAKWPTPPSSPATTSPALRKSCHGHRAWTSSWTRSWLPKKNEICRIHWRRSSMKQ